MKILNYEKLENRNVILKLSLTLDEFDESYAFCNDCGNVVDIDSAVEYDGSFYCNDCVEECSCCHQLIPNSALREVDDSSYLYCPHCWNEETYTCSMLRHLRVSLSISIRELKPQDIVQFYGLAFCKYNYYNSMISFVSR